VTRETASGRSTGALIPPERGIFKGPNWSLGDRDEIGSTPARSGRSGGSRKPPGPTPPAGREGGPRGPATPPEATAATPPRGADPGRSVESCPRGPVLRASRATRDSSARQPVRSPWAAATSRNPVGVGGPGLATAGAASRPPARSAPAAGSCGRPPRTP